MRHDRTGDELAVADTSIDINGDGTNDNGIDLDAFHIKSYLRRLDRVPSRATGRGANQTRGAFA